MTAQPCRSCAAEVTGEYCSQCGEKVMRPAEKSLRAFFGHLFHEITTLDGKFLKTLVLMLRKPGEVSHQYMNGRRVPFYKPVSMFFVANLVYFLFPAFNSLNSSLYVQMNLLPHSALVTRMVNEYLTSHAVSLEVFAIQYNQQATNMAKLFLILLVVYFSIPLAIVNFSRRMYFSDHLLVSLETCSLVILTNFFALIWILHFVIWLGGWAGFDWSYLLEERYLTPVSLLLVGYLFYQAGTRAYAWAGWRAFGKAALLVLGFYAVLQVYRGTLFFITFWSL